MRPFAPVLTALTLLAAVPPSTAPAAEYDMDCKLILCMAGGFPQNCGDALGYMIKRITSFPPKPPVGFCALSGAGDSGEGYENYDLDYAFLSYTDADAFECGDKRLFHALIDGDKGRPTFGGAFCYSSSETTCVETGGRGSEGDACDTEYFGVSDPEKIYEMRFRMIVEPGTDHEFNSGLHYVDYK